MPKVIPPNSELNSQFTGTPLAGTDFTTIFSPDQAEAFFNATGLPTFNQVRAVLYGADEQASQQMAQAIGSFGLSLSLAHRDTLYSQIAPPDRYEQYIFPEWNLDNSYNSGKQITSSPYDAPQGLFYGPPTYTEWKANLDPFGSAYVNTAEYFAAREQRRQQIAEQFNALPVISQEEYEQRLNAVSTISAARWEANPITTQRRRDEFNRFGEYLKKEFAGTDLNIETGIRVNLGGRLGEEEVTRLNLGEQTYYLRQGDATGHLGLIREENLGYMLSVPGRAYLAEKDGKPVMETVSITGASGTQQREVQQVEVENAYKHLFNTLKSTLDDDGKHTGVNLHNLFTSTMGAQGTVMESFTRAEETLSLIHI